MLPTITEGTNLTDYAGLPRRIMELLYAHPDLDVSASHMLDIDPGLPRNSHNVRLKRMETDGFVSSLVRKIPGERNRPRRFYRLTEKGLRELTILRKNFGLFPSRGDRYDAIPVRFPEGIHYTGLSGMDLKLKTIENLEKHKLRYARLTEILSRLPRSSECNLLPKYDRRIALLFNELPEPDFDGTPKAFNELDLAEMNDLVFNFIEICFKNSEEAFRNLQPDEPGLLPKSDLSPPTFRQEPPTPSATKPSEQVTPKVRSVIEKYMQTVERHRQEERALLAELTQIHQHTEPGIDQVKSAATKPASAPLKSPQKTKSRKRSKPKKN